MRHRIPWYTSSVFTEPLAARPVDKLRNDPVPLRPDLITLLADWKARNAEHIRTQRRQIADHRDDRFETHPA